MRSLICALLAGLAVCVASAGGTAEVNPAVRTHGLIQPDVQHIIVKLRTVTAVKAEIRAAQATSRVAALAARAGLALHKSQQLFGDVHVMQVDPAVVGDSVATTLARLRADSEVEYAEPDQRRFAHAVPNDPLFSGQWYLQGAAATPSAIDAVSAWDTTTGSAGVVIADLDTGVRFEHPDLQWAPIGRLLPGYDFITDVTTANDGDGRDADASDPGDWVTAVEAQQAPFKGNDCVPQGQDHVDSSWHGTRTAGILGALTNNGAGIAGITWAAWILPVRVLGKCGGSDSDIIAAMAWAAGMPVTGVPNNPYPAQIINMSLGGSGSCPQSYQDVINQLTARGVLVVVSAGNEGGPVDAPANCAGVAGIAGLRHAGTKVGFSSLGHQIALSAPAGNCGSGSGACLYSMDTTYNLGTTTPTTNGYTDQTNTNLGTSFSAPVVSAIAGLMLAVNGNLSSSQLIARLQEGSTPFPQTSIDASSQPPMCHDPTGASDLQQAECICTLDRTTCGSGMANTPGAVTAALRPIAAIKATYGSGGTVTLSGAGSAAACNHTLPGASSYQWTSADPTGHPVSAATGTSTTVTAPSSGTLSVMLSVTDDAGHTDTATVKLGSTSATSSSPATAGTHACLAALSVPSPITVKITPASSSLQAGSAAVAFSATVTDALNTAINWEVNGIAGGNSTVGTISASGLYTPPTTVASSTTVTVSAVSVADPTRMASAKVSVMAPPPPPAPPPSSSGGTSGGGTSGGTTGGSQTGNGAANTAASGGSGGGGGSFDELTVALAGLLLVLRSLGDRRRRRGLSLPSRG